MVAKIGKTEKSKLPKNAIPRNLIASMLPEPLPTPPKYARIHGTYDEE